MSLLYNVIPFLFYPGVHSCQLLRMSLFLTFASTDGSQGHCSINSNFILRSKSAGTHLSLLYRKPIPAELFVQRNGYSGLPPVRKREDHFLVDAQRNWLITNISPPMPSMDRIWHAIRQKHAVVDNLSYTIDVSPCRPGLCAYQYQ